MPAIKNVTNGYTSVESRILALLASRFSVQLIEDHSVVSVRRALSEQSLSWADADANGLQVFVIGTAPNEAQRFRALSVAGGGC